MSRFNPSVFVRHAHLVAVTPRTRASRSPVRGSSRMCRNARAAYGMILNRLHSRRENSASKYSFGGIVSGLNGSFHEALPVCDVLAGKKHSAESLQECVPHGEPLAGTIESVRASSKWIRLPDLLLHC